MTLFEPRPDAADGIMTIRKTSRVFALCLLGSLSILPPREAHAASAADLKACDRGNFDKAQIAACTRIISNRKESVDDRIKAYFDHLSTRNVAAIRPSGRPRTRSQALAWTSMNPTCNTPTGASGAGVDRCGPRCATRWSPFRYPSLTCLCPPRCVPRRRYR